MTDPLSELRQLGDMIERAAAAQLTERSREHRTVPRRLLLAVGVLLVAVPGLA